MPYGPLANARRVNLLQIHLYVAMLVALLSIVAVWRKPERRITLYVVTLQILLGIWLLVGGLRVTWLHPALAIAGWSLYMAANAVAKRDARRAAFIAAGGSLLVLVAYGVGQMAVKAG